jgi:hypothetical protein
MTKLDISLTPKSIDRVLKQVVTIRSNLEGYFLYDTDEICINLNCDTFRDATERVIINNFQRVVVHEFLHKLIYEQTKAVTSEFEEKVVHEISKRRKKW